MLPWAALKARHVLPRQARHREAADAGRKSCQHVRQRVIHRVLQPAPHRVPQWSSRLRHRQPLSPAAECRRASHWALPERLWSATGPRAGEQRRLRRGRTRPWKRAGWQLSGRDAQRGSGPADGALSWRALLARSRGALSWRTWSWMRTRSGDAAPLLEVEEDGRSEDGQCKHHRPGISTSSWMRTAGLAVGAVLLILALRAAHEEARCASGPNPVPRVASESCRRCNRPPRLRSSSDGPTPTLPACAAAATTAVSVRWSSATGSSRCTCSPSARSSSGCTCRTGTAWSGSGQG